VGRQAPELALKAREDPTGKKLNDKATYIHRLSPMPRRSSTRSASTIGQAGRQLLPVRRQQAGVRGRRLPHAPADRIALREKPDGGLRPLPGDQRPSGDPRRAGGQRDLVTAINFIARPALGAHDDLLDQLIMYAPGGISYGALDDRGNPLIKQLLENADISAAANPTLPRCAR
jgi:hypothetical protein